MPSRPPRLAARAVILIDGRLLLVNAWPGRDNPLWCAPGGGVERGSSLPDTLTREVAEETGLRVAVQAPCLVNEFHEPGGDFHQVDVYFRARVTGGRLDTGNDPEGVVNRHVLVTPDALARLRVKPDALARVAWTPGTVLYDPLEPILR